MLNFGRHLVGFFSSRQAERKKGKKKGSNGGRVGHCDGGDGEKHPRPLKIILLCHCLFKANTFFLVLLTMSHSAWRNKNWSESNLHVLHHPTHVHLCLHTLLSLLVLGPRWLFIPLWLASLSCILQRCFILINWELHSKAVHPRPKEKKEKEKERKRKERDKMNYPPILLLHVLGIKFWSLPIWKELHVACPPPPQIHSPPQPSCSH